MPSILDVGRNVRRRGVVRVLSRLGEGKSGVVVVVGEGFWASGLKVVFGWIWLIFMSLGGWGSTVRWGKELDALLWVLGWLGVGMTLGAFAALMEIVRGVGFAGRGVVLLLRLLIVAEPVGRTAAIVEVYFGASPGWASKVVGRERCIVSVDARATSISASVGMPVAVTMGSVAAG